MVGVAAAACAVVVALLPWGETWGWSGSDFGTFNATTSTAGALLPGVLAIALPVAAIVVMGSSFAAAPVREVLLLIATVLMAANLLVAAVNWKRVAANEMNIGVGLPLVVATSLVAMVASGAAIMWLRAVPRTEGRP